MDLNDKILITGANGLIGSTLVSYLKGKGYQKLILLSKKECDLTNKKETFDFLKKLQPTYVFHLAATVCGIFGNMKNHPKMFLENSLINLHVIEACRQINVKKIVAMGTCAAYPSTSASFPLKEDEFLSGDPHHTEYGYAEAKRFMLVQLKTYDVPFVYVVSTNLYGPNDTFDTENGHVIPSLIKKFYDAKMHGKNVIVWGNGTAKRDFLYSEDAARALFICMEKLEGVVNMASGTIHSIREAVNLIAGELNLIDKIYWDASKPNGRRFRPIDVSKLKGAGFVPKYNLREGLLKTFQWFSDSYKG